MKTNLYFTVLFLLTSISIQAQYSESSIGLRLGGVSGMSFKYVEDNNMGFELIAGAKERGFLFTAMIEKYKPIATKRMGGLYLFTGGGAHAGYSKYTEELTRGTDSAYYYYHERTNPVFGGDFIIGVEYQFESIPLNISLDYKPYIEFFGEKTVRLDLWDIGFTVRYAINR